VILSISAKFWRNSRSDIGLALSPRLRRRAATGQPALYGHGAAATGQPSLRRRDPRRQERDGRRGDEPRDGVPDLPRRDPVHRGLGRAAGEAGRRRLAVRGDARAVLPLHVGHRLERLQQVRLPLSLRDDARPRDTARPGHHVRGAEWCFEVRSRRRRGVPRGHSEGAGRPSSIGAQVRALARPALPAAEPLLRDAGHRVARGRAAAGPAPRGARTARQGPHAHVHFAARIFLRRIAGSRPPRRAVTTRRRCGRGNFRGDDAPRPRTFRGDDAPRPWTFRGDRGARLRYDTLAETYHTCKSTENDIAFA